MLQSYVFLALFPKKVQFFFNNMTCFSGKVVFLQAQMMMTIANNLRIFLIVFFSVLFVGQTYADKTVEDLAGEDRVMYDKFRHLFTSGEPEEFYSFVDEYAQDLHKKGYMMLYYKLLSNRGFYALRHHQIFQAAKFARQLDTEVRSDGAKDYYYLATGLFGDVYSTSHNNQKAERYFIQALDEVGDRDPKFTMRTYMNLAEMLSLKAPRKALEWANKSIAMAEDTQNIDYLSMSLAMKCYVFFLMGDAPQFFQVYNQYVNLRNKDNPEFDHRYDNIVDAAKLALDNDFEKALQKVHEGNLAVDSSLAVIRIYALANDTRNGFDAILHRYAEMDSIYSLMQDANFNEMASEASLLRSQEEAAANKKLASRLTYWLIGMTVVFLFVYIMGRRRLMLKIWARGKELNAALSRAEESDHMKSAFIRHMTHEIRTPLNAVSGFSQILTNPDFGLSEEERIDMQHRISENVDLITTIVNELLELSKSESEGADTEIVKTDVRCNEFCRALLEDRKDQGNPLVELRFASNLDDDYTFHTNAYRLRSSLGHLLDNAQKFTDIGHIELKVEATGRLLVFSVTDTGVGIDIKNRETIFEDFAKLNSFKEGIGLGLPITRRLITSLGGEVELDSTYTRGSRFVITFQIA